MMPLALLDPSPHRGKSASSQLPKPWTSSWKNRRGPLCASNPIHLSGEMSFTPLVPVLRPWSADSQVFAAFAGRAGRRLPRHIDDAELFEEPVLSVVLQARAPSTVFDATRTTRRSQSHASEYVSQNAAQHARIGARHARRTRAAAGRRPTPTPTRSESIRGNHLSNTTCLTHAFFKSGE